jgi:hypothetical protein
MPTLRFHLAPGLSRFPWRLKKTSSTSYLSASLMVNTMDFPSLHCTETWLLLAEEKHPLSHLTPPLICSIACQKKVLGGLLVLSRFSPGCSVTPIHYAALGDVDSVAFATLININRRIRLLAPPPGISHSSQGCQVIRVGPAHSSSRLVFVNGRSAPNLGSETTLGTCVNIPSHHVPEARPKSRQETRYTMRDWRGKVFGKKYLNVVQSSYNVLAVQALFCGMKVRQPSVRPNEPSGYPAPSVGLKGNYELRLCLVNQKALIHFLSVRCHSRPAHNTILYPWA